MAYFLVHVINQIQRVNSSGKAMAIRKPNGSLFQREIEVRRSFVTSLTCLGLFEANGKPEQNSVETGGSGYLWSFLADGVKLTLLGTGQTQSRVWKAPTSLFEDILQGK